MNVKEIKFSGELERSSTPATSGGLQPDETYRIGGFTRDTQPAVTIDAEKNDKVLQFVFNDDTSWMCDAATLHELFPEIDTPSRSQDQAFHIPVTLEATEGERGVFGTIAVKLLHVFAKDKLATGVGSVAKKLEEKLMGDNKGLCRLTPDFKLVPFEKKISSAPYLLFIHGTNSNISDAFSDLLPSELWKKICKDYGDNVLAFQHRTLTESPLQNAVELMDKLPDRIDLHIISHSRGGLIGDIICRYATNDGQATTGFSAVNIELLQKEGKRENDIACINALNEMLLTKRVSVRKFVRIACPAAGTRLASKRLDNILNVFFNLMGGGLNPVADILKELIAESLKTKDDLNVLPGLEAQNPDSPFIKILNDRLESVQVEGGPLAVISGNGRPSVSLGGLKVILAKLFYGQRNDLVVNTDSMYLGANRKGDIQYFFDQGPDVDHHRYFSNPKTREAIGFALQAANGEMIPGFTRVAQYEVPATDRDLRGFEHGELFPYPNVPSATSKKPIVVLLPGIMGSNISRGEDRIWLAYLRSIFGGMSELQYLTDTGLGANSVVQTSYKQLADRLSYKYDVVIYPFDWRKQLADCARAFNDKIVELLKFDRPIKLIGHSMGGVLIRDFILGHHDTWQRLNKSKDFRILFLGAPLGGSFRILTVLFGNDSIINSLNMLDRKHTKKELIAMFCKFPGILSLLPITREDKYDFANAAVWKSMADAMGDTTWPIPAQRELDQFAAYRNKIIERQDGIDYDNMVYIAGEDKYTPCDYYNDMIPPRTELVFLVTSEGDQSVTWASGIPKQLIEKRGVYYAKVSHGALANAPAIFSAIEDILEKGTTDSLQNAAPGARGGSKVFRLPEVPNFDLSQRGLENAVFGIAEVGEPPVSQIPISISVSNGDLAYASYPVLAGHFLNDGILYAEKAIDTNVNESLTARHRLGIYPGEIGTSTVVSADTQTTGFPGAIIVGLGDPGNLTSYLLSKTVEQGVSSYLLQVNSKADRGKSEPVGISAVSIANGYGGLSTESSLKAIIEGINNANINVTKVHKNETKTIQYVEFIEIYKDRALNCLYTLRNIESKENRLYNIRIGNKTLKVLFGWRERLPVDMSEEWWNRISIKLKKQKEGNEEVSSLVFSASTGDAREEENELYSSTPLIDLFVSQIANGNQWEASSAKTLFELMIPNAFKDRLKRKGKIGWILDEDTAAYPWELLQDGTGNTKPFCVNAGMIRQLATSNFNPIIKRVPTEMALIIADPQLDGFANQLKGARDEGEAVEKLLSANSYPNVTLINSTAPEICKSLFKNDYKIVHLAAHGVFKPGATSLHKSGIVIGKDQFLGAAQIAQLPSIPEIVFVNCCHLGKQSGEDERFFQDRYKLAANLSTQLIKMGVKVVVAAGWAVDDAAALKFATSFYSGMLEGESFGDAVRKARSDVYEDYHKSNNTWGAYQCYGDPFYKLVNRSVAKRNTLKNYVIEEEVVVDLTNLLNTLDTRHITPKEAIDELNLIVQAAEKEGIRSCAIAEARALVCYELSEYDRAIETYSELIAANEAKFSVASLEKYCNSKIKKFAAAYKLNGDSAAANLEIDKVIADIENILKINKTPERLCLLGSAYKRKGLVTSDKKEKKAAYTKAAEYYKDGYESADTAIALNNWIVLQAALDLSASGNGTTPALKSPGRSDLVKTITERKAKLKSSYRNLDYWELAEDLFYDLDLLMLNTKTAGADDNWLALENKYTNLWKRAGSKGKKVSDIENFEIVNDVLQLSTEPLAKLLRVKLQDLQAKLQRQIIDE